MPEYVFVYGTLRRHECHHACLDGAEPVAEQAYVYGRLWDTGQGYPAVVPKETGNGPEDRVYGEIYRITPDILVKLDELEDYTGPEGPNLYDRVVRLVHADRRDFEAYVYVFASPPEQGRFLASGDWKVETRLNAETLPEPLVYFAYGSCMDEERFRHDGVERLFQDVWGRGMLRGYELTFTRRAQDGFGRADIVETPDGRVEGRIYRIGREAVDYLYGREGVAGRAYRPVFVDVEHDGKTLRDVLTFTAVEKVPRDLPPPEPYAEEILRGARGVVSGEYYRMLEERIRELLNRHGST